MVRRLEDIATDSIELLQPKQISGFCKGRGPSFTSASIEVLLNKLVETLEDWSPQSLNTALSSVSNLKEFTPAIFEDIHKVQRCEPRVLEI